jgi:hypothetical protein
VLMSASDALCASRMPCAAFNSRWPPVEQPSLPPACCTPRHPRGMDAVCCAALPATPTGRRQQGWGEVGGVSSLQAAARATACHSPTHTSPENPPKSPAKHSALQPT